VVRVGTSGFSYEDWKGVFYPPHLKSNLYLSFYSNFFDVVEIDSTYYNIPHPKVFEALSKKVPPNFRFSIKVPSNFTHKMENYEESLKNFRRALQPIRKFLGCLLAQFPFSFKFEQRNFYIIERIAEDLSDLAPLCVEFRHISWQREDVYKFLKERNITYVNVDLPRLKELPKPSSIVTSDLGYFRFHGRVDAKSWWNPKEPYERYNYEYKEEELKEILPLVRKVEKETKEVYLLFNNHFRGKAVKAALIMKKLLGLSYSTIL